MRAKRRNRVLGYGVLLLAAGLLYGVFVAQSGLSIPCLFRWMTGLRCPGCGVTKLCVSLLRLDFSGAFAANPMLFLLLPWLGFVFLKYLTDYVKTGRWQMGKVQNGILYVSIGLLVLFCVLRNIYGF